MGINVDSESLEQAIVEFNHWHKGARLYLDITDGKFETSVYHNDVIMSQTFSTNEYISVYSKLETEGNVKIGKERKKYIIKLSNLLLDGWDIWEAEYKLAEDYI